VIFAPVFAPKSRCILPDDRDLQQHRQEMIMKRSLILIAACGLASGFFSSAQAQGVNLDCTTAPDTLSYYCNHRDQFGKNGPTTTMNPYSPDMPGAAAAMSTGSIAGSMPQAGPAQIRVSSCAQRFRTYDRNSNTYMGSDGHRHACR
jgi:hypothetical protein